MRAASALSTQTTMPMPQLKVLYISASTTLPCCCSQSKTGGRAQAVVSMTARLPARSHRQMIDLNASALAAMLAQFVPGMVRRGRGRILNVASIAAFQPVPTLATYAATKAFVLSLS